MHKSCPGTWNFCCFLPTFLLLTGLQTLKTKSKDRALFAAEAAFFPNLFASINKMLAVQGIPVLGHRPSAWRWFANDLLRCTIPGTSLHHCGRCLVQWARSGMHWQPANNKFNYFIAWKNQLLVMLHLWPATISGMGIDLLEDNDANAPRRASSS